MSVVVGISALYFFLNLHSDCHYYDSYLFVVMNKTGRNSNKKEGLCAQDNPTKGFVCIGYKWVFPRVKMHESPLTAIIRDFQSRERAPNMRSKATQGAPAISRAP